MVLFVLHVVLSFGSVPDEILWCDHSDETSSAVLSHGTIYFVHSSNFWVCGWNPMVWPFKWNLFSSTFTWYYLLLQNPMVLPFKRNVFSSTFTWCYLLNAVLTFQPVEEILWCNHSNKTSPAVLSYGAIHFESHFWVCGWNSVVWPCKWNLLSTSTWCHKFSVIFEGN